MVLDTLQPWNRPKEKVEMEKFAKKKAAAAEWLYLAKTQNKKARNSLIASFLTVGLFYPVAFIWLVLALLNSYKAYRFYRKFSTDENKRWEAENTYQNSISILIVHLAILLSVLLYTTMPEFLLIGASFEEIFTFAIFCIGTLLLGDLLFFKVIF
jgi:uncharacterized membrane protein